MRQFRYRSPVVIAGVAALGAAAVLTATAAQAAAGCRVDYGVTSSWGGGFGAGVTVTNLGDAVTGWTVSWSFAAGQTVTQLWNGSFTQSGSQVSVTNAAYNGSLATGGSTNFGFNGSWTGSNPDPASFTLNGVTCTGVVGPSSSVPSVPVSSSPSVSASPSTSPSTPPAGRHSCDIYAAGGTPCVAAHSTTRALYGSYNGPLYQVRRSSDNTIRDIGVRSAGGVANSSAQDSFCTGTTCLITIIYDQSGRDNRLTQAPRGYWPGPGPNGVDNLANATAAPITIGGSRAYGVYVAPGTGYRNNRTNGVATGDQPEGIYAVVDGTHYNQWCCFDYGNAQTDGQADAPAIMETVYFGANKQWGYGAGAGPWVMADLEWGLFSGVNAGYNNIPPVTHRFVTGMVKGEPNHWAIRNGNAQSGGLTTAFDGRRPNGYHPMKKEGAILLGIGGDNSVTGRGTFYEGVLTSGYPTAATENAVQADITAAGYR